MTNLRKSLISLSILLSAVCLVAGWKGVFVALIVLLALYLYVCAILFVAESLARASERQRKDSDRRERLAILLAWAEALEENARLRKGALMPDADTPMRMREAEAFNSTEYERESDGKRVA